ncbi:MAG: signal peptide peptidase SppA [Bacteroidia bacterium]|nr:signal peptide peptidase SppA [Bacteroidia bacterium]
MEDHSVLHLQLDAQFTEMQVENPFAGLPLPGADVRTIGLLQLKEAIAKAKEDPKISGIWVDVSYPITSFSTLAEIRASIDDFKKSGKWVLAYGEVFTEGAYYLASAADKVYLNPEGDLEFNGLSVEIGFYKRLFDKLEIKPQIFRVGEFKSAVEPFMLEKMSEENRLQLSSLINAIYDEMIKGVAASRNLSEEKLKDIASNMLVRNAAQAREAGLVDSLLYDDQFRDILQDKLHQQTGDKINFISYNKYRKSYSTYTKSSNEIAVIVAEGTIMPGESDDSQQLIGADTFVEELRKARENERVKAIVLRVNSPGGEFRASDMIWREVRLASEVKPIIASMSDYAASGGYYLSMGCDTIVAQPTTITGSIGIFGVMFDLSGFLGNKIGITFDEVRTGKFGEMFSVTRPLTQAEKDFWQKSLDEHYETFVQKAADGRGVGVDEIMKVASGRVWSGSQGKDRQLVDVLGGFDDAVKIAASKAGVSDDYKIKYYPVQRPFIQKLLSELEDNAKTDALRSELGIYYEWYMRWHQVERYQGAQARLPFEMNIH